MPEAVPRALGDPYGGWSHAYDVDSELSNNSSSYYDGKDYSSGYGAGDFSDSQYYNSSDSWDDDWDSNDWDSNSYDSWDAGDSDWDSDW